MAKVFTFTNIRTSATVTATLDSWADAHAYGDNLRRNSWGEHSHITDANNEREIYTYETPPPAEDT